MDYSSINFFKFLIPEYRNQYKSHVLPNITPWFIQQWTPQEAGEFLLWVALYEKDCMVFFYYK